MRVETLSYISDLLKSLDVPYSFMEWKGKVPGTYFVGEYQEVEALSEDGMQESLFILTGFTRDSFLSLEEYKETIENKIEGTAILDSGSSVAIFYGRAFPVPGSAGIKKLQINLTVKEWKVK